MPNVIEIVSFKTKPEYSTDQVIELSKKMDKELKNEIPGFISRRLVSKNENEWVDIVEWESMKTAISATELALTKKDCLNFFETIEEESTKMEHYDIKHSI